MYQESYWAVCLVIAHIVAVFTQYQAAVDNITKACESGDGNLLSLSIEASRARASVEEITNAMEKVSGLYWCFSSCCNGSVVAAKIQFVASVIDSSIT